MANFTILIALTGLGLAGASAARGQDAAAAMMEHPATSDYRLSARGFEDAYGFNDTARAVIQLYYARWNTGLKIMKYAGYPVPVATALGRHYEPDPRTYGAAPNYSKYYYDPWVAPVAFSLLGISTFGFIKATTYNRRQLYTVIRQYRATRRLPASVPTAALRPYLQVLLGEMAPAAR
ncbi:hypothetical protein BEN48_03565 [Hymenobacter glacialis]|uniref:Uncharacterized protein n=1 Tax=Hymenobacter glacialis TaxID=1908236 RepID=A0A1G1SYZ5_9BACT|nr:hypothetical protein BEN48_03565 [Hymenobacter glacialis]